MTPSAWKCPTTKAPLYITNSARYWCSQCQSEHAPAEVDPMDRDFARLSIALDATIERHLEVSFERR